VLGDDVPQGNLNADMEVQSRESGKLLALKGRADLTGLMLNDPEKQKLMKPMEVKIGLDSSLRDKVLDIAQLSVALTPTQLAKNEATLKGRIDATRTEAITGKLELLSDALDLNGYYDLVAGGEEKKAQKPPTKPVTSSKPAPRAPETSPATKDLPFKDFVINTRIANVYLRELHLTNVVTGIRVDTRRVDVKPIALALNGAPISGAVSADLAGQDLGYDLALNMERVPLAPIANSFAEEYRGRAKGDLNVAVQIKGVGTTGTTLKKTLQGQITTSCTNGQIELAGKKMRKLIDNVAGILRLPELRTAPLTAFDAQIALGDGKIQIKGLNLLSKSFSAHTAGAIAIADVLTNSAIPRLPVTFAVSQSLAERLNLGNAPPDGTYVPLPPFLFLTGTLGAPDTDRNDVALAGIVARGVLPNVGGDAGKILDALLKTPKGTNAASTNAPSTNKPANPLDRLLKNLPK
jgi:AsmA family